MPSAWLRRQLAQLAPEVVAQSYFQVTPTRHSHYVRAKPSPCCRVWAPALTPRFLRVAAPLQVQILLIKAIALPEEVDVTPLGMHNMPVPPPTDLTGARPTRERAGGAQAS